MHQKSKVKVIWRDGHDSCMILGVGVGVGMGIVRVTCSGTTDPMGPDRDAMHCSRMHMYV